LFYADKENRHKNDPDFDRTELMERCKEQWRNMSDKKKVVWINWALEEEAKYQVRRTICVYLFCITNEII
jgi:upstream-binding transcription factor